MFNIWRLGARNGGTAAVSRRRFLSEQVGKVERNVAHADKSTVPASAASEESSSSETVRDVLGFLVLSVVSGGYLLWDVKDLGLPQKKKKSSDD